VGNVTIGENPGQADYLDGGACPCLIVDDDPAIRDLVARSLPRFGYRVLTAGSGAEALETLRREEVPLVLTDVQMPGMDGVALLEAIVAEWPETAVVVATAMSEVDVAVTCLRKGAHDFLTKPFQLSDLTARLSQALDKRRLILENRRYQNHLEDMVREQGARLEELFLESVQSLAHALDARDSYTQGHSARVRAYAGAIARAIGLDSGTIQEVELGAELHDIGKIGITDDVLLKPAPLNEPEYRHLMDHTRIGARILHPLLKNLPLALAIVRSHHERLDGSGFPDGLGGDAIPLGVRIVSVADSFDAMTTARPYRGPRSAAEAVAELRRCSGAQFDSEVVAAFISSYPPGTEFPIATPRRVRISLPPPVAGVSRPGA